MSGSMLGPVKCRETDIALNSCRGREQTAMGERLRYEDAGQASEGSLTLTVRQTTSSTAARR